MAMVFLNSYRKISKADIFGPRFKVFFVLHEILRFKVYFVLNKIAVRQWFLQI